MSLDPFMRRLLFLPTAATTFADSIDHLHFFVIAVTFIGSAIVGAIALFCVFAYRRRGLPAATPRVSAPAWLELSFAVTLLSLFVGWWYIGFRQYIDYATPPPDAQDVYVTGKQWMWQFAYPEGRGSVGVLIVPAGRPIRLIITSRDVIHSFYVPAFRIKRDALPGRYTTTWFEAPKAGTHDIYCAEFCGTEHSRMWASVVVLGPDNYRRWLEGENPRPVEQAVSRAALVDGRVARVGAQSEPMAEQGRRAATERGCLSCHTIDGQRHIGPTWHNLYGRWVDLRGGGRVLADEQYLTRSMMEPQADVVAGYRPVMPTYFGSLPQPDAAAIVEFIKTLHDGHVRPAVPLPRAEVVGDGGSPEATVANGR